MQMTFDFRVAQPAVSGADSNDYHVIPASEKQLAYARRIANEQKIAVPDAALQDRKVLSGWIDAHARKTRNATRFSNYPSSKQVAFAERIARLKRRTVPDECFRDRQLMSRWIDSNL